MAMIIFFRLSPNIPPPLRAEKTALGTIPTAAFQYCEPLRTASSFGWHIFPPQDIRLRFNGVDTYVYHFEEWIELKTISLSQDFIDSWRRSAPEDIKDHWPPFLTSLFVPGVVQIWSGLLVKTTDDWSLMIGAPPNILQSRHYSSFEGIVETDQFSQMPLFTNIQLHSTDRDIVIRRTQPLFTVRALPRIAYLEENQIADERECYNSDQSGSFVLSEDEWEGYKSTIFKVESTERERPVGSYAASRRKRAKKNMD